MRLSRRLLSVYAGPELAVLGIYRGDTWVNQSDDQVRPESDIHRLQIFPLQFGQD